MSDTAKPKKARASRKNPWINVTAEEASGAKVVLSASRQASEIYTRYLKLTADQETKIQQLYNTNKITDLGFRCDEADQLRAAALLASYGLDLEARESLSDRWTTRWSHTSGRPTESTCRVLYQCHCSYDHIAAGVKNRRIPFNFTGCLAHAEVTYGVQTQHVLRIRGCLEHNDGCSEAVIARIPAIPLHPSVYQVALKQLRDGATLTDIQDKNRTMLKAHAYPDMPPDSDFHKSPYRWLLRQGDTRSLYRQFNRIQGVKVNERAHINIHEWLDKTSSQYNPTLAEAVFHYAPRATKGERFEVCIATPEMREAAWEFAHEKQIILDGTFGVCDKKLLLFILMGVDGDGKGVPLSFLMFSAPSGNKHTAAGYNTEVIEKLLGKWRDSLGKRKGKSFEPLVAITDTDLMERGALLRVFPRIWLLICKFHLRQSWRNHRNKLLKGKTPVHMTIKARLRRVEEDLVHTVDIENARAIIAKEKEFLDEMRDGPHAGIAEKGIEHLVNYLLGYWVREDLWCSWSDYGRRIAAQILKCPFEGVLPTTNHLESFNGVLKRKHLRRWQRNGRRLREDILIKLLVTRILPSIFEQRTMERAEDARRDAQLRSLPGGEALLAERLGAQQKLVLPPIAYLSSDKRRQEGAIQLLEDKQISTPDLTDSGLTFRCYSSLATEFDPSPTQYHVFLGFNGTADCNCDDFVHRGGACKHIRAALLRVDQLRDLGVNIPTLPLPTTPEEARSLQNRMLSDAFGAEMTPQSEKTVITRKAAAAVDDVLRETEGMYDMRDSEEGTEDSDLESDTDTDSVATDAGDEFDFTDIRVGDMKAAVEQQAVARAFFELSQAAPKLAHMAHYLRDARLHVDDLDNALTFRQQLGSLTEQLDRLILDTQQSDSKTENSEPTSTTTQLPPISTIPIPRPGTPPQRSARKRAHPEIIGASPEKLQKRKNSYAPH